VTSVYLHTPFCARRCPYCDYAVTVSGRDGLAGWVEALGAELDLLWSAEGLRLSERLDTLYVGGGTPSHLGPDAMHAVADLFGPGRLDGPELEWTAEANPEDLTPELASEWAQAGVTRLSLGVQSLHGPSLNWLGRRHEPEDARRAVEAARCAGFRDLTVDLLFGLPEDVGRSWRDEVEAVVGLEPDHVSLYGLTVEPGTELGRAVASGGEVPASEARRDAEYLEAAEILSGSGYLHYEVSNFARDGRRARHDAVYRQGGPYLGLGNGAHSFAPPVRRWNLTEWDAYRERCLAGRSPEDARERLDADALRLEEIWLSLRTRRGWALEEVRGARARRVVEGWVDRGLALEVGGRIRLTPRGWLLLDELTVALDEAQAG